MKKKPSTKPSEQDLKDWESFINNINSIEDKDAVFDKSLLDISNQKLFDIRKDLHGFKMHEALNLVSSTLDHAIDHGFRKVLFKFC